MSREFPTSVRQLLLLFIFVRSFYRSCSQSKATSVITLFLGLSNQVCLFLSLSHALPMSLERSPWAQRRRCGDVEFCDRNSRLLESSIITRCSWVFSDSVSPTSLHFSFNLCRPIVHFWAAAWLSVHWDSIVGAKGQKHLFIDKCSNRTSFAVLPSEYGALGRCWRR